MASGLKQTKNNHFEATYEHPWGGVAADAYPTDIAPNQMVQCDGLNIKNGVLNGACIDTLPVSLAAMSSGSYVTLIFTVYGQLCILDNLGNIYVVNWGANSTGVVVFVVNNTSCVNIACVQVINNIAYFFSYITGSSFVFDLQAATLVLGSNFVGGQFCCVVDNYLLTANTNQPTDTPPFKNGRVNWSGPDEYTTWDPSVDRNAGFNVLGDVQDSITGIFPMGNVAYVLRQQGITQLTPTGVGISPFDFTSLWASEVGIGCDYPTTFAQYGPIAIWANDSDIMSFNSGSAPQGIGGAAKSAIFKDIFVISNILGNGPQYLTGAIYNASASVTTGTSGTANLPVTPDLRYVLCIVQPISSGGATVIFWTYNFKNSSWTRTIKTIAVAGATVTYTFFTSKFIQANQYTGPNAQRLVPLLALTLSVSGAITRYLLTNYESSISHTANAPNTPPAITAVFKQEELQIARKPDIRGVAVIAKGNGSAQTLNISVQNESRSVAFTPITVTSTTPKSYISNGVFTDERPQAVIQSNAFDGSIVKVLAYGTYADGELP